MRGLQWMALTVVVNHQKSASLTVFLRDFPLLGLDVPG